MKRSILGCVLLSFFILLLSAASFAEIAVGISVRIGPPPLPVYAQPICPGPGYFWTPGYWAWNDDEGYYWVPGTWVVAPVGMLWTPGYWGWGGGVYMWHPGYWGHHIGFYGGVNYGYGYTGVGFYGGEWRGERFYYNRSVTNVSVTNVNYVYNKTVIVNRNSTVSYNGGPGGINMRPTPQEEAFSRERHTPAMQAQMQHEHAAMQNRQNFAAVNHGRPAIAATARPADFSSHSAVPARAAGGEYHPPAMAPREARVNSNSFNRGNATPANRGANEGYRSFTPPAKGGNPNANMNVNRGNSMPANHGNSNEGYRPFTPPARGNSNPNANSNRGNSNPNVNANRTNENRYNENRSQNQPNHQDQPTRQSQQNYQNQPNHPQPNHAQPERQSPPREAPHYNQSAPRESSRPSPQPERRQSAPPKEERPR